MSLHTNKTNICEIYTRTNCFNILFHSFTNTFVFDELIDIVILPRFGTNGTDCILRLICDVNRYSLSHNGLIGQLLYTVFT